MLFNLQQAITLFQLSILTRWFNSSRVNYSIHMITLSTVGVCCLQDSWILLYMLV